MLILQIAAGAKFHLVTRAGEVVTIHGDAHVDARVAVDAPADVVILRDKHVEPGECPAEAATRWRKTPKPNRRAA
ncbi:MAG: hypothetical protein E6R03_04800 [Hyphomicrobiaceae bacterium]|nr:MAG: hypothetical protein E6R03_04800 [Hyphomicrobiaceae bacterium]